MRIQASKPNRLLILAAALAASLRIDAGFVTPAAAVTTPYYVCLLLILRNHQ
jgi:hypothetical protein